MKPEKQIEEVMKKFDFETMIAIMRLMKWKWVGRYPTVEQVKAEARGMLERVTKLHKTNSISTGGLTATYQQGPTGFTLHLEFVAIEAVDEYR